MKSDARLPIYQTEGIDDTFVSIRSHAHMTQTRDMSHSAANGGRGITRM
jgi:hypothetical protein